MFDTNETAQKIVKKLYSATEKEKEKLILRAKSK
jgi:hypothetical protein